MIQPPALNPGDLIYITAPAKLMDPQAVSYAKKWVPRTAWASMCKKGRRNQMNIVHIYAPRIKLIVHTTISLPLTL